MNKAEAAASEQIVTDAEKAGLVDNGISCLDCDHMRLPKNGDFYFAECCREGSRYAHCSTHRCGTLQHVGDCGSEGRYFEARVKT